MRGGPLHAYTDSTAIQTCISKSKSLHASDYSTVQPKCLLVVFKLYRFDPVTGMDTDCSRIRRIVQSVYSNSVDGKGEAGHKADVRILEHVSKFSESGEAEVHSAHAS